MTYPLPEDTPSEEFVDRFVDYFIEKIKTIPDSLANYPTSTPTGSFLAECEPYREEEIMKILKSILTKSCENDAIPTQDLKRLLPLIITLLTTLINLALEEDIFAETWKVAIICPLTKKLRLELVNSNYRLVSNLSFLPKVVDSACLNGLTSIVTTTTYSQTISWPLDKTTAQKWQ